MGSASLYKSRQEPLSFTGCCSWWILKPAKHPSQRALLDSCHYGSNNYRVSQKLPGYLITSYLAWNKAPLLPSESSYTSMLLQQASGGLSWHDEEYNVQLTLCWKKDGSRYLSNLSSNFTSDFFHFTCDGKRCIYINMFANIFDSSILQT